MSNERIDLTQFEGMTKGPWRIPEYDAEIVDSEDYAVLWVDFSGESPEEYMFRNSALHCADEKDIEAMAKVPELIAELKRCYDLIDSANASMKQVRERVLGSTLDWDDSVFQEVVDVLLTLD